MLCSHLHNKMLSVTNPSNFAGGSTLATTGGWRLTDKSDLSTNNNSNGRGPTVEDLAGCGLGEPLRLRSHHDLPCLCRTDSLNT